MNHLTFKVRSLHIWRPLSFHTDLLPSSPCINFLTGIFSRVKPIHKKEVGVPPYFFSYTRLITKESKNVSYGLLKQVRQVRVKRKTKAQEQYYRQKQFYNQN